MDKTGVGQASAGRFDHASIALHWLTLALVIVQLTTAGLLLAQSEDSDPALLLAIHRSSGVAVWLLVAARLAWRLTWAHKPPFPASLPRPMRLAAQATEYGLYALLLAQPLTGLGDTLTRGHAAVLFGLKVPALMTPHKDLFHAFAAAHAVGAALLLGLIGLHTSAALFHGLVRRDGVLGRMLPWTAR